MQLDGIDLPALRHNGLFVATPMYSGQCFGEYALNLAKLSEYCGYAVMRFKAETIMNDSIICTARNTLVQRFLDTGYEHLLFWDSDVGTTAKNIFQLMALQSENPQYDIIGAIYPQKSLNWDKIANAAATGADSDTLQIHGLRFPFETIPGEIINASDYNTPIEVSCIPTGMMMIRRRVFDRFAAFHNPATYISPPQNEVRDYFQLGINKDDGIYYGEDFNFCRMSRQAGLRVWLCPWMNLTHIGQYSFRGSLEQAARILEA